MNKTQGAVAPFALLVGAFLIIEGIWGMFSPVVFGVLSTNKLHACIHIVLGALGVYAAMNHGARLWSMAVGAIVLVVGVLYFVPVLGELTVTLFNVNNAVAILNIIVGVVGLLLARSAAARVR